MVTTGLGWTGLDRSGNSGLLRRLGDGEKLDALPPPVCAADFFGRELLGNATRGISSTAHFRCSRESEAASRRAT